MRFASEPISRAEIARETELQRSTISHIVESLKDEGLVEEVGEGESTGGRRPTLLKLRTKEAIAIGVAITPSIGTACLVWFKNALSFARAGAFRHLANLWFISKRLVIIQIFVLQGALTRFSLLAYTTRLIKTYLVSTSV
ncbi:MAG: winged helix-turn-helix domain-containing protein [Pyrinomonadaceae bacterium]